MPADKIIGPPEQQLGNRRFVTRDHWGPVSYPTGGEILDAKMFSMSQIDNGFASGAVLDSSGALVYVVVLYFPNGTEPDRFPKLLWQSPSGTQVTSTTDLSGHRVRLTVFGV